MFTGRIRADVEVPREKVEELSDLLQGNPLCIVLAAARYEATRHIDAILDKPLAALRLNDPTEQPKERAADESIAWSERLLVGDGLDLFDRLSVFYGGWEDEAMSEICFGKQLSACPGVLVAQGIVESLHLIKEGVPGLVEG